MQTAHPPPIVGPQQTMMPVASGMIPNAYPMVGPLYSVSSFTVSLKLPVMHWSQSLFVIIEKNFSLSHC